MVDGFVWDFAPSAEVCSVLPPLSADVEVVRTKDRCIQREPDSVDLKTEALRMSETCDTRYRTHGVAPHSEICVGERFHIVKKNGVHYVGMVENSHNPALRGGGR
jgi:hypothetical protein